jgi:hypothetical protein
MDGLEFYTSKQLIGELMSRSTFAGIILYSEEEQTQDDQFHSTFNCLTKAEPWDTVKILMKAARALQSQG